MAPDCVGDYWNINTNQIPIGKLINKFHELQSLFRYILQFSKKLKIYI